MKASLLVAGSLESDGFRSAFLAEVAAVVGRARMPSGVRFDDARQRRLDHLADLIEQHVNVDTVLRLIDGGPPAALPVLTPGDSRGIPA